MRETFSSKPKDIQSKRERLQSQGPSVKPAAMHIDNAKAPARQVIEGELNQTLQIKTENKDMTVKKREGGSEAPRNRRDAQTIEYGNSNVQATGSVPATAISGERQRGKGQIIRSRVTKQSKSPDSYQLNNNLVVQLADPIRKPVDMKAKMYQTAYKQGTKASFFPSTATATTNGSSNDYSSQTRQRTTEGGYRTTANTDQKRYGNAQQRPQNQGFKLNLPLRFGKNQIERNLNLQH